MTRKSRKPAQLTAEVHVRMMPRDLQRIGAMAQAESRSVSAQIVHIVRQALADYEDRVSPSADPTAERIRNAPREAH